jgi:hypothetical protein
MRLLISLASFRAAYGDISLASSIFTLNYVHSTRAHIYDPVSEQEICVSIVCVPRMQQLAVYHSRLLKITRADTNILIRI